MVYSTRFLCSDEKQPAVLRMYQGACSPDKPFAIEGGENVSLAGGFPGLSPDTSFFLSPTLQLNTDLATYSESQLTRLAEAELRRFQRINFRSYTVDVDARVCIISKSSALLDSFIETYGGILEVEPLLLESSDPDYPCVTDVNFTKATKDGCKLHYRKRAPLRADKCTYCGKCGAVCPENCISPKLDVDYSRCTYCKECEKICDIGAMDIYGVEEVMLRIPAVILLGKTGLALPEDSASVYREDQLPEFFKTLYSAEIKEVVCHSNTFCQYSGRLNTGCARCVDSCPHGAISKGSSGIVIDHGQCQECGHCMAVCPTGAMQNGNFSDAALLEYLNGLQDLAGGDLVIGEEDQLHQLWWQSQNRKAEEVFYLEYSSLNSLSFYQLLLFFALGFSRVTLLADRETGQAAGLRQEIGKANYISRSLFGDDFAYLSSVTEYEMPQTEHLDHPLSSFFVPAAYTNRREMLMQTLQHLVAQSGKFFTADPRQGDFISIKCADEGCTQCLACLNECKMNALQADDGNYSLTYQAGLCVGCTICVQVCPEKVLSVADQSLVDERYFIKETLSQAEPARCSECGKIFGTRKSLDRVMQILAARETVDASHFELCSDCRVVKLFTETATTEGA